MSERRPTGRGSLPATGQSLRPPGDEQRAPKVKGVAFRSLLACAAELRGEEFVETALRRMSADQSHTLRYTVVQTGWYPIELYRALWGAFLTDNSEGYGFVHKLGAAAIRRDAGGVYRVLFKVLSIETLITLSSKLFPYYYDTGKHFNERVEAHLIRSHYEGCIGFDRAMWEELVGTTSELVTMAGAKRPRVGIVRGGHDHSPSCVIQIQW